MYGTQTFDDLVETCRLTGRTLDLHVEVRQTDDEAEMIAWVQEAAAARMPAGPQPRRVHALLLRAARRARHAHRAAGGSAHDQPGPA